MDVSDDVERGDAGRSYGDKEYQAVLHDVGDLEHESLLPTAKVLEPTTTATRTSSGSVPKLQVVLAFLGGAAACFAFQYAFASLCFGVPCGGDTAAALGHAGSPISHQYPPPTATNNIPSMFPTNVGYPGPTPTGAEAGVIATAPSYPIHSGAPHLVGPSQQMKNGNINASFDVFRHWGNLSPWYSVPSQTFGLDTTPDAPKGCAVTQMHLLHRHGARYPTTWSSVPGPAAFAFKLQNATDSGLKWKASGDLNFLNDWTYKLGGELLTPFGRQQLYDLGVSMRLKYGFLLQNFTEQNALPVFRTESQDRMLYSALNFAIGFFGYPHQDQYLQEITIEAPGFNNTLCPYKTCPNAVVPSRAERAVPYVYEWTSIYLKDAVKRINALVDGLNMDFVDVYTMQQVCAYETVALGYSKFCELFTEDEWEGFEYTLDLYFWYSSAYGSPVARIQGVGWIQELIARLTNERIKEHNTSTNGTLDDNDTTFPLGRSLYVDATHEVVFLNILTALNLSNFAADGPLPSDHIPKNRKFISSQLSPFATNMQVQILSCQSHPDPQIRLIINDGVTPLTSIRDCPSNPDGMCPLPTFIKAQKELLADVDWEWECHGEWDLPAGKGWNTTTGKPPPRPEGQTVRIKEWKDGKGWI